MDKDDRMSKALKEQGSFVPWQGDSKAPTENTNRKHKSPFALSLDRELVRGSLSHTLTIYGSEVHCSVTDAAPYRKLNAEIEFF